MKPFFWERTAGKRIVLCGPLIRCVPVLMEFPEDPGREVVICDDDHAGESFKDVIRGLEIPELEHIRGRFISCGELYDYRDDCIILAGKTFFYKYCKYLEFTGLEDFYSAVPVLKRGFIKEDYFAYFASLYRKQREGLYLSGIELILTKGCSLRCRDCANLIQYYDRPKRLDQGVVIRSLKKLLKAVDGVAALKLLGGEPLLEQDMIKEILQLPELLDGSKVLGIQIISNGTILFRQDLLEVMQKNPYASVLLSNYKDLSSKENEIIHQLSEYQIPLAEIGEDEVWRDYGDPRHVIHNEDEAAYLFKNCNEKEYCVTLLDGRLYSCPRAAHGAQLGFYADDHESIDILDSMQDEKELRERIRNLFFREDPVEACIYCDNNYGKFIERAVQMDSTQR